jgi:cytochrome d ubiquinol oxidase subunit II
MSFLIPTILFYTVYSYYVFRGKVTGEGGYH